MSTKNKILIGVILIATMFLGIGYAAIESITLDIVGTATAVPTTRILVTGENFNKMVKGATSTSTSNTTITRIVFDYWEYGYSDGGTQVYSNDDWESGTPIDVDGLGGVRLFKSSDGTKVYILSEAPIYANLDSSQMFRAFKGVTNIAFNNLDTSKVQNMLRMFSDCSSLKEIDLSNLDTSKVQNMRRFFNGCTSLTTLDLSNFDTSSATTIASMFDGCSGLTSLDLSNFNTTSATDLGGMFRNCSGLTSLDLSNFNTSSATGMVYMFYGCSGLTGLDLSNFNTSSVTNMESMFQYATNLKTLDVSSFDTSKVTLMRAMFAQCWALEKLDISNFNTSKVTDMNAMFYTNSRLITIYVGDNWTTASVTDSDNMFYTCSSLVGGAGTTYNSSYIDKTYARIDGGPNSETPGYLTLKSST